MKILKTSLLILLLLAGANMQVQSQQGESQTKIVAEGTDRYPYSPFFYAFGSYQRTQTLYPESLLEEFRGTKITELTFYRVLSWTGEPGGGGEAGNVQVIIGTTTENFFAGHLSTEGMPIVYSGTLNVGDEASGFTLTIPLNPPVEYNGGNLLIQVNNQTLNGARDLMGTWIGKSTGSTPCGWYGDNTSAPNPTVYQNNEPLFLLPKMQIRYETNGDVTTHTITANQPQNGTITPSGSSTVVKGANKEYTITPATGYEIDKVMVDNTKDVTTDVVINIVTGIGIYTFSNVTANHSISVTFKPIEYRISYHHVNDAINTNDTIYTIATPTFPLVGLTGGATDFLGWYADSTCTGATVTQIATGSYGDKDFWAKWKDDPETGFVNAVMQNIRIYTSHNIIYIINQEQIALKSIEVIDMLGKIVYASTSVQSPISLNVAEGQYIVRLTSGDAVKNRKITINN